MSRWNSFGGFTSRPKKPPPERGLRVKTLGTTWWGQRWIAALETVLSGDTGRLTRGRSYARAGRTHDLIVKGSKVTAKVTGSRSAPYRITIELTPLDVATWNRAITAMSSKAQFAADLLAGEMPKAIDEVFAEAGASLFPRTRQELKTNCSCPDWGDPCKHVAATHYVLGEALDHDPFLLFELRGKTKTQVLEALRAARGVVRVESEAGDDATEAITPEKRAGRRGAKPEHAAEHALDARTVPFGKVQPQDYDELRGEGPSLHLSFDVPVAPGVLLRQLGSPAVWDHATSPAELLAPIVRAAADAARRVMLADERVEAPEALEALEAAASPSPASRRAPRKTASASAAGKDAPTSLDSKSGTAPKPKPRAKR